MYRSPNSSEPFNPVHEAKEVEYNGVAQEQQEETPEDLRGGGQDLQNEEDEEQAQKILVQRTKTTTNDVGEQR
jgi:hypothetical protein